MGYRGKWKRKNRKRTTTITIISTAPRTRTGTDTNVTSLTERPCITELKQGCSVLFNRGPCDKAINKTPHTSGLSS